MPKVHILARAVIENKGRYLLCHYLGAKNTFLPGGHVEPEEGLIACLARELLEELGLDSQIGNYLGAVEHLWQDAESEHYEINHCFEALLPDIMENAQPDSCEADLEFLWVYPKDFIGHNLQPAPLRQLIADMPSGGGTWWATNIGQQGR